MIMVSEQEKGWCDFTVKIVPGKGHLDSIYFGNLLMEALGQARDLGLGVVGFELVRVGDFEFLAKILARRGYVAEMVLKGTLEALQDSGYGFESFKVKSNGEADGAEVEQKAEKEASRVDPRDLWVDLA